MVTILLTAPTLWKTAERGILHAEAVAKKLQKELIEGGHPGFDVISTSPLLRTVQTAECLSSCTGIPLQIVPGLCECAAAVHDEGLHLQGDALALKRYVLPLPLNSSHC